MSAKDPQDPNHAKYIRNLRSTDQLMRQFLKLESGLGNNPSYQRGHEFAFGFTQAQKDAVNELLISGMSFEEAFDKVKNGT